MAPLHAFARPPARRLASSLAALLALAVGCGSPGGEPGPFEPIGTVEQAVHTVCADGETVEGIDVSYWQSTIDWPAVAADSTNIRFAIARVSHGDPSLGGVEDTQFAANWAGIQAQGLVRGVYQYWDPGVDPTAQADYLVGKVGRLGPGDLPAVVDVEETNGQSASTIITRLHTWMDLVETGTGRRPIIYTGSYFWDDNVGSSEFADAGDLVWTAHYTSGCPLVADPWDRWTMHQYTSSGSVDGIGGNVDRDYFNGTWEMLNDLAANGYRAEIVSLEYPATMSAGGTGTAQLVVRNTGARAWGTDTWLGTTEPRDRPSPFQAGSWASDHRVQAVQASVAPGSEQTFSFDLQAPAETGDYLEHFNLLVEAVAWFSDTPPGGGPGDAEIELAIRVGEPGTGGAGAGAGGAGAGDVGGLDGPGSQAVGVPGSDDAGCACDLTRRSRSPSGGILGVALLALGLLVAHARQRPRPASGHSPRRSPRQCDASSLSH
jgi:lysozyme